MLGGSHGRRLWYGAEVWKDRRADKKAGNEDEPSRLTYTEDGIVYRLAGVTDEQLLAKLARYEDINEDPERIRGALRLMTRAEKTINGGI